MRVGIDVGGTTVKVGFVDGKNIVYDYEIETKGGNLFEKVFENVCAFAKEKNIKIDGVGIGVPGHVENNYITKLPNVGLENFDIALCAKKYFSDDIVIKSSNDANVAALGEAVYSNIPSCFMVTLGTGVGGGMVKNYKIVEGAHYSVGEIGHMVIDLKHNYQCTCGLKGCLETVSSATGITRLAYEYQKDYRKSSIDFSHLTAKEVVDNAKLGDELAIKVLKEATENLGRALASVAVCVDPEAFFIGGGVAKAGDFLIDMIKHYYKEYAHFAVKDIMILPAKLGNKAGIFGASQLVEMGE